MLVIGLVIGWFLFGESASPSSAAVHDHGMDKSQVAIWTCSMHPQIRQNEPGKCPICGMNLITVETGNEHMDPMAVTMSATAMQLANVETAVVGTGRFVKSIRLNGKIQADERLNYSQVAHIPGRIEQLSVNYTGEQVQKGQKIAVIYSPNLVTAQEELLEANRIKASHPELFRAAQEKLKNWKLSDQQINQILVAGQPIEKFPVYSEVSGIVMARKVNLGDYVMTGMPIFEMVDLSTVWVLFEVYEADMQWVKKGDVISFTVASLPGESFEGKITFVDPVIDPVTRVAKTRLEIQNKNYRLKPEMFASGQVQATSSAAKEQIIIPKSAVMWTGERSLVYVMNQTHQGVSFMMRQVTLGPSLGDSFIIIDGLKAGEEIAVHGTFSIDAAAQLAGKPSMMNRQMEGDRVPMSQHNHQSTTAAKSADQFPRIEINLASKSYPSSDPFKQQLQEVFTAYLRVKEALVQSDVKKAIVEADKLQLAIGKVDMKQVSGEAHMEWMKDLKILNSTSTGISGTVSLEEARKQLSPLSDQLFHSLKKFEIPVQGYRQYCPMAFDFKGAFWLSDSEEIFNPYFGDEMLTCGNVEEAL